MLPIPFSLIMYPIYPKPQSVLSNLTTTTTNADNNRRSPLGVLVFGIFWKQFIQNILPRDNDGIVVVFTDTCGPPFTYQLNGPEAIYLGPGDLHDAAYDSLGQHYSIGEIMDFTQDSAEGSSYTGLPVSETFCPRTVHIYPSDVFYDSYVTNNPAVFTTLAAVIFLFTSVVFVMYDCIVERRQRIVKKQALASGAIVSSLFPEQVRHHLYKEQRQQEQQQQQQEQKLAKRQDLNSVLSRASNDILGGNISNDKTAEVGKSPPIADMYQETTIFFADLAGFTAWSSKRTPIEVFELLETLYGTFDKIAMKRKV